MKMLKLTRILHKTTARKTKWMLSNSYCAVGLQVNSDSFRAKARQLAKEKYKTHPLLLYNSQIEFDFLDNQQWKPHKAPLNTYTPDIPKNWMDDYEFYEGGLDENDNINSKYGIADASVAPSVVPCSGCGAHMHCVNPSLPGYLPSEIFRGRTDKQLQTVICQRCHFLKHYDIALDVEVTPETYVDTISRIRNEYALAVIIVDLLDFPASIWPGMAQVVGTKRPVIVVGNKVDLLPRDSNNYLQHIKSCLTHEVKQRGGFDAINLKYIGLISAKTGYGIEELITQLHKIWMYNGDVYIMGCTNVGKSSLFNILLNSDYCRPQASDLVRKATTCPWPGTTLQMLKFPILRPSEVRVYQRFKRLFSEKAQLAAQQKLRQAQAQKTGSVHKAQLIGNVGRTFKNPVEDAMDSFSMSQGTEPHLVLNERSKEFQKARWCYDTPGVMHPSQITNLLNTNELIQLEAKQMIIPRAFRFKPGMSIFLGGLARLDLLNYQSNYSNAHQNFDWIKAFVFSSLHIPVSICNTVDAEQMYAQYLGTPLLAVPNGTQQRLEKWPGLSAHHENIQLVGEENRLCGDVMLSSAGWIGLSIPLSDVCVFQAWTPEARGIFVRTPALIPHAYRLTGKLVRNSLAYKLDKPFVFRK